MIAGITCLRNHELRLFHLVSAYIRSPQALGMLEAALGYLEAGKDVNPFSPEHQAKADLVKQIDL